MGFSRRMDFAQHLKSQVDIVRVVSEYGVRLRRVGRRYSGLCPFHSEKTPSFSVSEEHQFYKCFGCDAKGDVITFVMSIEGLTFWESLRKLAEQHGVPLPKQSFAADDETRLRAVLYEMHEIAAEHFRANLHGPNGASALAYLEKRGLRPETIHLFGLGFAERSGRALERLLSQHGFRPEQMEASGLIGKREDGSFYDRFRNRLMFPIHSESGKVIAFGGRALDPEEKAKYLNSPETKIYKKSHVLFNLHRARKAAMDADRIVLVEGYMDAIGATQAGVTEVVASCGTALTVEQIRMLRRHSANLHLNFDPDTAGASAAERSIRLLLDENVRVRVVELQDGLDPDEYCGKFGADAYRARIASAKTYFYWLADRARGKFNMRDPQGRIDAFQFLMPAVQGLHDKLERVAVVNDLASYLGVEPGLVLEHFRKAAADRAPRSQAPKTDAVRPMDRILLPLILTRAGECGPILERLRALSGWRALPTARVYETLLGAHERGEPLTFASINDRLSEADQLWLASLLLDAVHASGIQDGLACLAALERQERDAARQDLRARIRAAERERRLDEAFMLMQQLRALEQES
jgi:DNA primase